jgi:hypothetical protein
LGFVFPSHPSSFNLRNLPLVSILFTSLCYQETASSGSLENSLKPVLLFPILQSTPGHTIAIENKQNFWATINVPLKFSHLFTMY